MNVPIEPTRQLPNKKPYHTRTIPPKVSIAPKNRRTGSGKLEPNKEKIESLI